MVVINHVDVYIGMGKQTLENLYFVILVIVWGILVFLYFDEAVKDGGPSKFIQTIDPHSIR